MVSVRRLPGPPEAGDAASTADVPRRAAPCPPPRPRRAARWDPARECPGEAGGRNSWPGGEAGSLDKTELRYSWYKQLLKKYDEQFTNLYPPSWQVTVNPWSFEGGLGIGGNPKSSVVTVQNLDGEK